jgi:catechol 2,3-dioxygenase-like lactoylglutathione lyase family enzyme
MIQDFSHVTISCSDLERSIAFYERIGLVVERRIGELDADGVARAFDLPRGHLTVAHLRPADAAGTMTIDLVQWLDPPPEGAAYARLNNLGLTRLAFRVDNIDDTVRGLRAAGLAFLSDDVQEFGRGVRSIAFKDPDGTIIQLIEGLAEMKAGSRLATYDATGEDQMAPKRGWDAVLRHRIDRRGLTSV